LMGGGRGSPAEFLGEGQGGVMVGHGPFRLLCCTWRSSLWCLIVSKNEPIRSNRTTNTGQPAGIENNL
jgi:hypothetical protein